MNGRAEIQTSITGTATVVVCEWEECCMREKMYMWKRRNVVMSKKLYRRRMCRADRNELEGWKAMGGVERIGEKGDVEFDRGGTHRVYEAAARRVEWRGDVGIA